MPDKNTNNEPALNEEQPPIDPAPEVSALPVVTDPASPDFDKSVYDETIPGGRIIVNGVAVNAEGEPI